MGWVYNLHTPDPNSEVPRVIAICLVFSITAFLAVCLRFFVRLRTKRTPWIDDYAVLASSILTFAYAGITIAQTRWGQGLSAKYFPPENVKPFSHIQFAGGPVYTLDLLGFKVALLASYLRIGGFVDAYRKVILAAIAACVCNQIAFTLTMIFSCTPVARIWDTSLPGHCIDSVSFYYALAGTSIGFDLIIIALPLPVLWRLQLRTRQKVVLTCLFALGFFVTIIQIVRIFSVKNLKTYTDSKNLILWSIVEVSLGIIVACIPSYGPLFKAFASTMSSYRIRETGPSYPLSTTHHSNYTAKSTSRSHSHSHTNESSHAIFGADDMQSTTMIASGKGEGWVGGSGSDAESEMHILAAEGNMHIHAVTEVMVERGV